MDSGYGSRSIRRISATVLSAVLILIMLTGCGNDVPEGYYKLDSFNEDDSVIRGKALEEIGLAGSYIVIRDGSGYIVLKNTPEDVFYDAREKSLHTVFGHISASLAGQKLTLADSNLTMTFTRSNEPDPERPGYPLIGKDDDKIQPAAADAAVITEPSGTTDAAVTDSADESDAGAQSVQEAAPSEEELKKQKRLEFWNGYWFGWWEAKGWSSSSKKLEGYKFAVIGKSRLDENGNGHIDMWNNEYNDIATVDISNSGDGRSDLGVTYSESGYFWDGDDLVHADWIIDPGLYNYKDYIRIDAKMYYEGKPDLDYTVHLVKWGSRWDDMPEELRPAEYEWYLYQLDSGITDPTGLEIVYAN